MRFTSREQRLFLTQFLLSSISNSPFIAIRINHHASNNNTTMFTGIIEGLGNIVRFDKKTSNRSSAKMKIEKQPKQVKIWIEIPKQLSRHIIKKGSVTVDGISLTVVGVYKNKFSASIIPHTTKLTNLRYKKTGDKVNIETDILGKYILSGS